MTTESKFLPLFLSLFIFSLCPVAIAEEYEDRSAIERDVFSMFITGNFHALDNMSDKFRREKARTGSGLWKLGIFYNAFTGSQMLQFLGGVGNGEIERQTQAWIDANPKSISAHVARATVLADMAWKSRNGAYWSELTEEEKSDFWKYHALASQELEASKDLASVDPNWYLVSMKLATEAGLPDAQFYALLDEASAREPYYYPFYFQAMIRSQPGWSGSYEAMERAIRYGVEKTAKQDGKSFLARGYWYASDIYALRTFKVLKPDWGELKSAFGELVAQYPDDWNRNAYARLACLSGDTETGNLIIKDITDRKRSLISYQASYSEMLGRCEAGRLALPIKPPAPTP